MDGWIESFENAARLGYAPVACPKCGGWEWSKDAAPVEACGPCSMAAMRKHMDAWWAAYLREPAPAPKAGAR